MRRSTVSLPIFSSDIVLSSLSRLPIRPLLFIFSKWCIILVYIFCRTYLVSYLSVSLSLSFFLSLFRLYTHEVSRYTVFNLKHLSKHNICTLALIENRLIVTVCNSVISIRTTCSNIKGLFILPQKKSMYIFYGKMRSSLMCVYIYIYIYI